MSSPQPTRKAVSLYMIPMTLHMGVGGVYRPDERGSYCGRADSLALCCRAALTCRCLEHCKPWLVQGKLEAGARYLDTIEFSNRSTYAFECYVLHSLPSSIMLAYSYETPKSTQLLWSIAREM